MPSVGDAAFISCMADIVRHNPASSGERPRAPAPTGRQAPAPAPWSDPGPPEVRRLEYGGVARVTKWSELPITVRPPRGLVWEAAEAKTVRRDGQVLQVTKACALGSAALVVIEQVRPLETAGDGRYRPAGRWTTTCSEARPISGLVRLRHESPRDAAKLGAAGEIGEILAASSVVDALPHEVRRLLGPTEPLIATAYRIPDRHSDVEDIRALVIDARRIVAVHCTRPFGVLGQSAWTSKVWQAAPASTSELPGRRRLSLGRRAAGDDPDDGRSIASRSS